MPDGFAKGMNKEITKNRRESVQYTRFSNLDNSRNFSGCYIFLLLWNWRKAERHCQSLNMKARKI